MFVKNLGSVFLQAEKIKFQLKYLSQLIDHKDTLEEKKQTDGLTLSEQEELAQDNEALKVQHASEGGAIWGVIGGIGLATVTGLTGLLTLSALGDSVVYRLPKKMLSIQ